MGHVQSPIRPLLKPLLSTSIQRCKTDYQRSWTSAFRKNFDHGNTSIKTKTNKRFTSNRNIFLWWDSILLVAWILFSVWANTIFLGHWQFTTYVTIFINDILSAESDIISNICFDIIVYLCFLSIFTNFQIKTFVSLFFLWGLRELKNATVCYSPIFFNATVNWKICSHMLTSRLKLNCNKHNFCIWINIDLFMCLIGRNSQWSGCNNRWCFNRERGWGAVRVSWCVSYFRNAWEETYWLGHLDLIRTSGLRGARQSLSTPLAVVVQKIYLLWLAAPLHPPLPNHHPSEPFLLFLFSLYLVLSSQRWKENLISIRLNCGGQHYQFKRPEDLTAPTPWWLITSQQWWVLLFPCVLL